MNRSPMPPRTRPLVATTELRRTTGPSRTAQLERKPWNPAVRVPQAKSAARTETGFSRKTKLLVRTRAGQGNPEDALCEACGIWLGRRHGQVQHIIARGMGGCRDELRNSTANAALLCGTPLIGCHGKATALDREMGAKGFWLPQGADPRMVPMMLASEHGSGLLVWRGVNGEYLYEAPEGLAA